MIALAGILTSGDSHKRIYKIAAKNRYYYIYLTQKQNKILKPNLETGCFVVFRLTNEERIINGVKALCVLYCKQIFKMIGRKRVILFDFDKNKKDVRKLLEKRRYRMFLDLEFTMPSYFKKGEFIPEIIEYGFYLEDDLGNLVDSSFAYIKPTIDLTVSERTIEFLNVEEEVIQNGINYREFYKTLKDYMMLYQPVIYIWGKNDYLMIEAFYKLHDLKPVTSRSDFVNLMQIMKNYYGLKDDMGLYHTLAFFNPNIKSDAQDHNALHDAGITLEVFHYFENELKQ